MFIYLITNTVNGKIYVGQTINDPIRRFKEHCWDTSRRKGPLQNAINKYGKESFAVEVLATVSSREELSELEKHYIKELNARDKKKGYNLTEGGEAPIGHIPSEETCKKISETKKKQAKDPSYVNPMKGKTGELSPSWGKTHSEEHKLNMSQKHTGDKNPFYGLEHPKRKAVIVIDSNNQEQRYECAYTAAETLNLDPRTIHKICKGRGKKHRGYSFRYE